MNDDRQPDGPENGGGPNPWMKSLMVWGGIFLALVLLVSMFGNAGQPAGNEIGYSTFRENVEAGMVKDVTISPEQITGTMKNGEAFSTVPVTSDTRLTELLEANGVEYTGSAPERMSLLMAILVQSLPFILILGIAFFALRQVQKGGGGGAMGFGKSKAKMLTEKQGKVTFDDVAGIDEAREELEEIVEFLKDPQRFSKLGGQIPKGALLVGSPGTGKTLLARAIAGEAGVPFFTISGSDFVEMFVGVGASRVRDMFEQAKKNAPCIVFIDEIDAVGRHRGHGLGNSNDEREQTLNQLLVEMDGFEANEGIIIIAATNRPDVLDPALLRPGRFDRQVVVPVPDIEGREKILGVHMKKVPLAPDVNPRTIARGTPGFSGADLANLVNEAALLAARRNKRLVAMQEFEDAKDKVMMGSERRSMVMTDDEKKMTAYHEAGHALVSLNEPASDPIHKATIIPRGRALGMVMRLPERDNYSYHRDKMHADLAVAMGGRVAEEIIFGHDKVSSGASSDIQYATKLARNMVTKWGMSDKLGPLQYEESQEGYLGMGQTARTMGSGDTNKLIDAEIRKLVEGAHKRATDILKEQEDKLHLLAQAMLEYETLTGDEIRELLDNGKIDRPDEPKGPAVRPVTGSAIPKAGKRFGSSGEGAPQGA
ncbi:ATP-dependent zinc metalloprotease FtsH [Pelagerythrobacter marinus]|uniref:ATP-dependent zinc metalloprotease FtsH n=1 Tax=Pelagerythrobacter marinus TaxID=538382 RepID=A0ABW9UZT0_9SPHN|nr:ATP-dependent zinc metalloprotease FtsH [Pelagerythrobacter marinus]MEC9068197.1 ATP-dependent zinc metalloprotease FtsH [Pseudomonadota bacterium]MXO68957.1 ATP-dependent zinc metalloprotease FtsH [Pelagerythrobacter marinus]USA39253.1 ATP-dependent zinc metalloprotease FtsH [Pelagerythrobacter marinus]WPZ06660.1 ATP-dependent zinc metalloprotease FtsH [Pelagerythrobacter marinus]